jgi:hypothetical protein
VVRDEDRHERVEAARLRAELTVPELWLRYVALGGNGDVFDLDAYLNGLVPLDGLDQNVLAVAVNERLEELYRAARVPLDSPSPTPRRAPATAGELDAVIATLLDADGTRTTTPRHTEHGPATPPGTPRRATGTGEPGAVA